MGLRDYQIKAVEAVHKEWDSGNRRTLLNMATGTGKTVTMSEVVKDQVKKGENVLILAHREELLQQAWDKLYKCTGIKAGFERGKESSAGKDVKVVIGSVQTVSRKTRLAKYTKNHFQTIIIDEAHHCMSSSYQKITSYFNEAKYLGLTATPDRADKKSLGSFFDSIAFEYQLMQAIREGNLVPVIKAKMVPLTVDLSSVHIQSGDFAAGDVGKALNMYLKEIAASIKKYAGDRKTVIFTPLIETAKQMCRLLKKQGIKACEVDGMSDNRDKILEDFEKGKYQAVCNSMLLTEGWDCPSADCIVILRPTRSTGLYRQMVGRGTRTYPGKKDLLLLDFLWQSPKHDLCRPSTLVAKDEKKAKKIDAKVAGSRDSIDVMAYEQQIEDEEYAEKKRLAMEEAKKRSMVQGFIDNCGKRGREMDPVYFAYSIDIKELADYEPTFAWEREPVTERQTAYLEKNRIDVSAVKNRGMASILIDRIIARGKIGLSTPKQIKLLYSFGFTTCSTWTIHQATKVIDVLINQWHYKIPKGFNPAAFTLKG